VGKAALFILTALAAGLIVYILVAPRVSHHSTPENLPQQSTKSGGASEPMSGAKQPAADGLVSSSVAPNNESNSTPSIRVPRTNEQKQQDDVEARRGPLYDLIRSRMTSLLVGWRPAPSDRATFDLYMARDSAEDLNFVMNNLVQPYASRYGFSHVRFYVPNLPDSVEHWRNDSEADPDSEGIWRLIRK